MSNCHSKYTYFMNNKNRKLIIDNDDYINIFLKIIKDARQKYRTQTQTQTQTKTQTKTQTQRAVLNSQRVYPERILKNASKNKR